MGTMLPLPAAAGTPVRGVDVSGELVAVLCGDDVLTGSLTDPGSWTRVGGGVVGVALRGDRLFTARGQEVVALDDAGQPVGRFGPTDAPLQGFAVSADGRWVALGEYRTVSVWDVESGKRVARWRAHSGTVPHLTFSPDGRTLVTHRKEEIRIWSWRRPLRRARRADGGEIYGSRLVFLPDGRLAGALGRDSLGVWSPRGKLERALPSEPYVHELAVAPDGARLAARQSEGAIAVWSWPDGELRLKGRTDRMADGLTFHGDVLVAGDDAALMTWGDGVPAPEPERFVPRIEPSIEGTAPASALDWDRLSPEAVEAAVRLIPWLRHLGAANAYDAELIDDWDGWHGPEDRETAAFDQRLLALRVPVDRAVRGLERHDVGERMKAAGELVHERAASAVPFDPEEDPWHAPTNATGASAYVAETLAGYAAFGWPVPADLRLIWSWYEAGHWPCAMAGRRLLVY
jgi:WD domain, G-beta repeat